MFPFTRKLGCFECFLNDVYSVKPRKIAVLSIVSCQQNHALNVQRAVRFDVRIIENISLKMPVQVKKSDKFFDLFTCPSKEVKLF